MTKKIGIGVQLYSVRELAAKDLPGVLKAVKQMGYDAVEFAGYHGWSAYDIRKMLDANGLMVCGTHTGLDQLMGDSLRRTVDFHRVIGCQYAIVPWIPADQRNSIPAVARFACALNEIAERLAPFGMKTGYHAHGDDFAKLGNRSAWEVLFGSTSGDVVMQMDTGNAAEGGADPVAILKEFPGRSETVHLKESGGKHGAVIGEGNVNWKEVLEFCASAGGTKWYVVEHEAHGVEPMQAIARSREALRTFGI